MTDIYANQGVTELLARVTQLESDLASARAEVERLRKTLAWPRCDDCGAELVEVHPELPLDCTLCEARGKLAALRQQAADMERGVADVLNGAIGEQDMGVVAGVELLAERYAALRQRHAEREAECATHVENLRLIQDAQQNHDIHPADELRELRQRLADMDGQHLCAYCGLVIPGTSWDALRAHIDICPKHPLAELRQRHAELETQLAQLRAWKDAACLTMQDYVRNAERHAEAVEQAWMEAWSDGRDYERALTRHTDPRYLENRNAAWLASEAKKGLEGDDA